MTSNEYSELAARCRKRCEAEEKKKITGMLDKHARQSLPNPETYDVPFYRVPVFSTTLVPLIAFVPEKPQFICQIEVIYRKSWDRNICEWLLDEITGIDSIKLDDVCSEFKEKYG